MVCSFKFLLLKALSSNFLRKGFYSNITQFIDIVIENLLHHSKYGAPKNFCF